MGSMSFQQALAWVKNGGDFTDKKWPAARRTILALKPPKVDPEIAALLGLQDTQVAAKEGRGPAARQFADALADAKLTATGIAFSAKGYFKQNRLANLIGDIPQLPKRENADTLFSYVQEMKSFVKDHPEIPGIDRSLLVKQVARVISLQPAAARAAGASKPLTAAMQKKLARMVDSTEDWVRLIRAIADVSGRTELAADAPTQPRSGRSRKGRKAEAEKPQ